MRRAEASLRPLDRSSHSRPRSDEGCPRIGSPSGSFCTLTSHRRAAAMGGHALAHDPGSVTAWRKTIKPVRPGLDIEDRRIRNGINFIDRDDVVPNREHPATAERCQIGPHRGPGGELPAQRVIGACARVHLEGRAPVRAVVAMEPAQHPDDFELVDPQELRLVPPLHLDHGCGTLLRRGRCSSWVLVSHTGLGLSPFRAAPSRCRVCAASAHPLIPL